MASANLQNASAEGPSWRLKESWVCVFRRVYEEHKYVLFVKGKRMIMS